MLRRFTLGLLAATAIGVVASYSASAADLARPVLKAPPPPPPPVQDWSGVYVGLEGGYGWGKANNTNFDPFFASKENEERGICFDDPVEKTINCGPDASVGSVNQSGWLAGGFVGAQKQWGSWVLGIEADFDGANIKGSSTATAIPISETEGSETTSVNQQHTLNTTIDELGTLRGKIGYAFSPNWMIYGTGGLAWAHEKADFSANQNLCFSEGSSSECFPFFGIDSSDNLVSGIVGSAGVTMLGWSAGAGLDYKWQIDQGSAVIFGVEYLHYQFPQHSVTFGGPVLGGFCESEICSAITPAIGNMTQTIDVIKGRISYLFSIH